MTEDSDLLTITAGMLDGLGLEDFIEEYNSNPTPQRRKELGAFLKLCRKVEFKSFSTAWDVRIATIDDMRSAGRIEFTLLASGESVQVDGGQIYDTDLNLIDISGGYIFSQQQVLVPHDWLLVEEIRHMDRKWLQSGRWDERLGPINVREINPLTRLAVLELPKASIKLPDKNVYFLFHGLVGTTSFGHFIIDLMGQLIMFDRLKAVHGSELVPVLSVNHWFIFKWPGMKWLFEHLVGPESNILHVENDCRVAVPRGYTTSRVVIGDEGLSFKAFRYLRDRICANVVASTDRPHYKRIYISRKDAGYREVENISKVEELLERFGFISITIESLTPQEAYDALSEVEIIVGMHGSGLAYHFYAPDSAAVIELAHQDTPWRVLLSTAAVIGHRVMKIRNINGECDVLQLEQVLQCLTK